MPDQREQEVVNKVQALIRRNFGGDSKAAFDHYASRRAYYGLIDSDELADLLKDADIGSWSTRGQYVFALLRALDKNRDGAIGFDEFRWFFSRR